MSIENAISDLKVLLEAMARDIEGNTPLNIDYCLVELNRVIDTLKIELPDQFGDISYIGHPRIRGVAHDREDAMLIATSKLHEMYAVAQKIHTRLQGKTGIIPSVTEEFIEATWTPDDFYRKLIDEINLLYTCRLPMSLVVMIRKLLENMIIDILRKKYGTQKLSLYYDASQKRFHDFSILLKQLDAHKTDFHHISPNLNKTLIKKIDKYRVTGNVGAHSIDADLSIDQVYSNKDQVNYIFGILIRILQNL